MARIRCAGCPSFIERGDLCCDDCWRRTPLLLRARLKVPHVRKNWPRVLGASIEILVWLVDHRQIGPEVER